jgi:hypothetical protein
MAESFGIAAGTIGIAAAFTACVDCFGYVQHGRHFGRDYQTDLISLDCARLRLTRWGKAVNIHEDPRMGRPDAAFSEVRTVQNALHQILVLFANTEKISRTYKQESNIGTDLTVLTPNDLGPATFGVQNRMKEQAIGRQKGASILKTSSWALCHRSQLRDLVSGIVSLLDNIEKMFPAPAAQLAHVKQTTAEIQDRETLEHVESVACNVDSRLLVAAKETLTGHQYLNVVIKGKAQTGDMFGSDLKGEVKGTSHNFDGLVVDGTGKALIGNKYGGKDFWDD